MAYFRNITIRLVIIALWSVPLFALAEGHPFYAETGTPSDTVVATAPEYGSSGGSGSGTGGSAGSYSPRYPLSYFGDAAVPSQDAPRIIVSGCREIIAAGTYVIDRNLSSEQDSCIYIHDTANVQINCGGHAVMGGRGIRIKNVNGFSLRFCKLSSADLVPLTVESSKNGDITNNTIGESLVRVSSSESIRFADNELTASYEQTYSHRGVIENNSFKAPAKASGVAELRPFMVELAYGTNNKVIRNTVDGRAISFELRNNGAADGIKIFDESGNTVSQNTVRNVQHCGIRTIGFIYNTSFTKNYVKNAGFCGIGADAYMSWDGNEVADNTVDEAPQMFSFVRVYGLRPAGFDPQKKLAADPRVYFKDNVFVNNVFVNVSPKGRVVPVQSSSLVLNAASQGAGGTAGERPFTEASISAGNNVVKGNNFSRARNAPLLFPYGMIVDGGGNVCGPAPDGYPIDCGPKIATPAPGNQQPAPAKPAKPAEPESFIVVTAPNGGTYFAGENLSIAWESDRVNSVTIELVDDAGRRVRTPAPEVRNTNAFTWVIPADLSGLYRIKIYDAEREHVTSVSAPFEVSKQSGQAAAVFPLLKSILKYVWYPLLLILGIIIGILAMKVIEKEKEKKKNR